MTTPAERLRAALPPRPKGGYEPGTREADTAAVLDEREDLIEQLDAKTLARALIMKELNDETSRYWALVHERDALLARIADQGALQDVIVEWLPDGWHHRAVAIADAVATYLTGPEPPAQESHLTDLIGLDPNFTGDLSTSEYLRHIRGEEVVCARCGGPWGDDETCPRCTTATGEPRDLAHPGPLSEDDVS